MNEFVSNLKEHRLLDQIKNVIHRNKKENKGRN